MDNEFKHISDVKGHVIYPQTQSDLFSVFSGKNISYKTTCQLLFYLSRIYIDARNGTC